MSHFVQLSVRAPQQSIGEVRAPGIVGLFVQGFQTGLVVSQLAQWLNLKRTESASMVALVAFVTAIGLSVFTHPSARLIPAEFFIYLKSHLVCVDWRRVYASRLRGGLTFAISDNL